MKTTAYSFGADKSSKKEIPDSIFGVSPIRSDILSRVIQWQLDKRRAGTHKTKTISEISGTTKKPFKQKGTGNARRGSNRAAQMRGGATTFGPVVRDHGYSLNKKVRTLGLKMALSAKAAENQVILLDGIPKEITKTKDMIAQLKAMDTTNATFILTTEQRDVLLKSAANIPHIDVLPAEGANVYSIMRRDNLVVTKESVKALEERLA